MEIVMKRVLQLLLVLSFIFIMAGCNSGETSLDTENNTTTEAAQPPEQLEQPEGQCELVGETTYSKDVFGGKVKGTIVNNTGSKCSYVDVTATFYDAAGNVLDSGFTNVTDLPAGKTWVFEIMDLNENTASYTLNEITWNY